uniref:CAAX prenyl protease 2/Lysostaphin resistance protein A-like domain-containing protein n=1 Tax=Alexandrium monilatum TaxID=311494 RepID=A0A7S4PTX0_9DINO|mmetsp:Transcript_85864/g.256035  ORF Transcript_85864/g.256035 Transcript_85864/m.256035 type:complete len:236 (+) Transcript_85864:275-982(+)
MKLPSRSELHGPMWHMSEGLPLPQLGICRGCLGQFWQSPAALGLERGTRGRAWLASSLAIAGGGMLALGLIGRATGFLRPGPPPSWCDAAGLAVLDFAVVAFVEEAFYRGMLLRRPDGAVGEALLGCDGRAESADARPVVRPPRWEQATVVAVSYLHELDAFESSVPTLVPLFRSWPFALLLVLLMVCNQELVIRTGSLWPAVVMHGTCVWLWMVLGGGMLLLPREDLPCGSVAA